MDILQIKELVKDDLDKVNNLIRETLRSEVELLNTINGYLFQTSGKQLRPLLSLLAAGACGGVKSATISCAAVAELIHTATLLHDDVADRSERRRGSPTVQSAFSPASSVLTGDYWLAKALSLLVKESDPHLMGFYTKAVEELSEGELFQLQKASSMDTTEEDYLHIIARKTSSLFVAAVGGAAYSAGASNDITEGMVNYAYHLGIAFQIRDDIFDYMPDLDTGKNAGTDIREKKITLPLICALNSCSTAEREEMMSFIKNSDFNEDSLVNRTIEFVKQKKGINCAQNALMRHSGLAIDALKVLEDSIYKRELSDIALYVGNRLI